METVDWLPVCSLSADRREKLWRVFSFKIWPWGVCAAVGQQFGHGFHSNNGLPVCRVCLCSVMSWGGGVVVWDTKLCSPSCSGNGFEVLVVFFLWFNLNQNFRKTTNKQTKQQTNKQLSSDFKLPNFSRVFLKEINFILVRNKFDWIIILILSPVRANQSPVFKLHPHRESFQLFVFYLCKIN